VINVTELARWLGKAVRPNGRRQGGRFSSEDVLRYLRPQADDPAPAEPARDPRQLQQIDRVIATLPRVVVEERLARRHPGFRRYFESLPRIMFFYGRGYSSDEIANEMNFIATSYGVETVMTIVAQTVASRLERAA
jgi:hypothetical protein